MTQKRNIKKAVIPNIYHFPYSPEKFYHWYAFARLEADKFLLIRMPQSISGLSKTMNIADATKKEPIIVKI